LHWYQLIGWIALGWLGVSLAVTPLVALFLHSGKQLQLRGERSLWTSRRLDPQRARGAALGPARQTG
jgi:hypothetical protein